MFDPSSFVHPTPRAHADASRDVLPRRGTSQASGSMGARYTPDFAVCIEKKQLTLTQKISETLLETQDFKFGIAYFFSCVGVCLKRFLEIDFQGTGDDYGRVLDESRSFFRVHTGYFSNIPKCIKAEFIASWGCSQSSVVSSSQR
ncbi:hypothetical protein TNCV_4648871 [Trichonephila clavipes]|uniref:Uncharacterized protein n=1 Tax=Trichonephila clavipes TaxID=2585209 RepID=A0A8X6VSG1_TRICX|nr:hypothetical protein TNCV_4648871 [Trichonephila clavipes]